MKGVVRGTNLLNFGDVGDECIEDHGRQGLVVDPQELLGLAAYGQCIRQVLNPLLRLSCSNSGF